MRALRHFAKGKFPAHRKTETMDFRPKLQECTFEELTLKKPFIIPANHSKKLLA